MKFPFGARPVFRGEMLVLGSVFLNWWLLSKSMGTGFIKTTCIYTCICQYLTIEKVGKSPNTHVRDEATKKTFTWCDRDWIVAFFRYPSRCLLPRASPFPNTLIFNDFSSRKNWVKLDSQRRWLVSPTPGVVVLGACILRVFDLLQFVVQRLSPGRWNEYFSLPENYLEEVSPAYPQLQIYPPGN